MKGIILSGGNGTRLHPLTKSVSKQLLPIFDKPMIFYSLALLIEAGIRDILIISSVHQISLYQNLLGDGRDLGINIMHKTQKNPNGIAEAYLIAESFLNGEKSLLILGDNFFYDEENKIHMAIKKSCKTNQGATIFCFDVEFPQRFGVAEIDKNEILSIEEKPRIPKSNYAISGLYLIDGKASEYAKMLVKSKRGELEITDLLKIYLEQKQLSFNLFQRESFWFDAGTFDSLLDLGNFVRDKRKDNIVIGDPYISARKEGLIGEKVSEV